MKRCDIILQVTKEEDCSVLGCTTKLFGCFIKTKCRIRLPFFFSWSLSVARLSPERRPTYSCAFLCVGESTRVSAGFIQNNLVDLAPRAVWSLLSPGTSQSIRSSLFPTSFFLALKKKWDERRENFYIKERTSHSAYGMWFIDARCFSGRDLCSSVHFEWATSCCCWENNTSSVASYVPSPATYPVSEFTARARRNSLGGKES